MPHPLTAPVVGWFSRLEHPTLFRVTLVLMLVSWLLPDPLPLLDELVTALGVLVLANWKRRGAVVEAAAPAPPREPPAE
ncbi:DUF6116 family protein [Arenimonas composti]|uniref:Uncharacterized protein n=1 Tax=Arenimonas composti TR7-09 = DSM 18010 TaxID=1121013 RepID=A0A091B999_9GAMM|nr:DUF6116 family protein [Arenimonas composti]KFN47399.1 hypothetical protein P873_01790 [Arenimonas composti TR7-09 = DSM 18010]